MCRQIHVVDIPLFGFHNHVAAACIVPHDSAVSLIHLPVTDNAWRVGRDVVHLVFQNLFTSEQLLPDGQLMHSAMEAVTYTHAALTDIGRHDNVIKQGLYLILDGIECIDNRRSTMLVGHTDKYPLVNRYRRA